MVNLKTYRSIFTVILLIWKQTQGASAVKAQCTLNFMLEVQTWLYRQYHLSDTEERVKIIDVGPLVTTARMSVPPRHSTLHNYRLRSNLFRNSLGARQTAVLTRGFWEMLEAAGNLCWECRSQNAENPNLYQFLVSR